MSAHFLPATFICVSLSSSLHCSVLIVICFLISCTFFPEATHYFTPFIYNSSVIAVIYTSLPTLRQNPSEENNCLLSCSSYELCDYWCVQSTAWHLQCIMTARYSLNFSRRLQTSSLLWECDKAPRESAKSEHIEAAHIAVCLSLELDIE